MVTARVPAPADADLTESFPLLIAVAASPEQRVQLAELVDDVAPLLLVSSLDELRRLLVPAQQPPPSAPGQPEPPEPDAVETTAVRATGEHPEADVLTIDQARSVALWRGREIQLTELEQELLSRLMSTPLRVWSYDALHQTVWRDRNIRGTADVHSVVKRLRRKLDDLGTTVTIDAVRGIGFRLTDHQRPMITDLRAG
ncbi:winged helix-turn-helix domain-containing protein [Kribbella speibonae]|uniref:Winged helix family transcriptional regulator n=1 Tax=Kribbella speibonae TaxID=1572660 RepID=A0A4R0IKZ8_9ACTN|nr:winged helix-turn-helix domain-containing protein [Kribbella speibonae]TCC21913.1 winged helix family transcriptional regulator [Kribbella speibonae]TCC34201.1 winged helix family transcriptional regulator [Kribbella speibonae]